MILAALALASVLSAQPQPGAAPAAAGVSYSYVGAYDTTRTPGATALLPQAQPKLAEPTTGHSLAEVTVQAAGQQQTVEVGWTVDDAGGDRRPHLFVFAWVNGRGLGYDCCGYVQTGRTWAPGDHVKPGISARYSIRHDNGKWWISYQGGRIGYYPDRLWSGHFTHGQVSQAFGEVASDGPGGTEMINGRTDKKISDFHLLGATTPAPTYYAPKSHASYRLGRHGPTWFYLGGH